MRERDRRPSTTPPLPPPRPPPPPPPSPRPRLRPRPRRPAAPPRPPSTPPPPPSPTSTLAGNTPLPPLPPPDRPDPRGVVVGAARDGRKVPRAPVHRGDLPLVAPQRRGRVRRPVHAPHVHRAVARPARDVRPVRAERGLDVETRRPVPPQMAQRTELRRGGVEHGEVRVRVRRAQSRAAPARRERQRRHPARATGHDPGNAAALDGELAVLEARERRARTPREHAHVPELHRAVRRARRRQHAPVVQKRNRRHAALARRQRRRRPPPGGGRREDAPRPAHGRATVHTRRAGGRRRTRSGERSGEARRLRGAPPRGGGASGVHAARRRKRPRRRAREGFVRALDDRDRPRDGLAVRAEPGAGYAAVRVAERLSFERAPPPAVAAVPQRQRAVPPAAREDVPAGVLGAGRDGLHRPAVAREGSVHHLRLHVPEPHGLVPGRGEERPVAAAPPRVEDGVVVRGPPSEEGGRAGRVVLGGPRPRRVEEGDGALLVRDGEDLAAGVPLEAETNDEGGRALGRVLGDVREDAAAGDGGVRDEIAHAGARAHRGEGRAEQLAAAEERVRGRSANEGVAGAATRGGERRARGEIEARQALVLGRVAVEGTRVGIATRGASPARLRRRPRRRRGGHAAGVRVPARGRGRGHRRVPVHATDAHPRDPRGDMPPRRPRRFRDEIRAPRAAGTGF